MNRLIVFLATGLYAGYLPAAPGTFGTLLGVLIAYLISGPGFYYESLVVVTSCIISIILAERARGAFGRSDPPQIVCDEIVGFLVSFFMLPPGFFNLILVFILFRFFDILKPYPVGLIDRGVKGGAGIVLDDVAAGVYANVAARIILWALG